MRYERLDDLLTAIACTLIRKQARLDCGEFRWLRKFTELSQREFAEKIGYDVQSVSLWERTAPSPVLVDRELRRLAIDSLRSDVGLSVPVAELIQRTMRVGDAIYYGTLRNGVWEFQTTLRFTQQVSASFDIQRSFNQASVAWVPLVIFGTHDAQLLLVGRGQRDTMRSTPEIAIDEWAKREVYRLAGNIATASPNAVH